MLAEVKELWDIFHINEVRMSSLYKGISETSEVLLRSQVRAFLTEACWRILLYARERLWREGKSENNDWYCTNAWLGG